ncbi:ribosome maturation protein SBDS-like protein [Gracilaria domingensis]|nr:ribosome maturation protein SBDS-like protein [Gracilaria domingensis]
MPELLVRLKKGKKTYEVMVEEGMVAKYRDGTVKRIEDVVVTPVVFVNARKATKASSEELNNSFQTDDVMQIIELILQKGEAQESGRERKSKMDAKKQEIINFIRKNYVTPEGHNLPTVRIENALAQVRPRIDVDVDATRQVNAMYQKLSAVMPMKKQSSGVEGTVIVPVHLAGQVSVVVREHCSILRETYRDKAKYDVEIHSYEQLMSDLARVTKGDFEFSLAVNTAAVATSSNAPAAAASSSGKKGKGKKKRK